MTSDAVLAASATADATFKQLLQAAPDPVVITECGRIVLVNRAAEVVFGYSNDELVGACVDVLLPERSREKHAEQRGQYDRAPRNRRMGAGLELFARRKDGSELPVEISLSPTEIDGRMVVISIVRDISERKRADAKIAQAERELLAAREAERQRLAQVIDVLPVGMLITDAQGGYVASNAAAQRILGLEHVNGPVSASQFRPCRADGSPYPREELPLKRVLQGGEIIAGEQLICPAQSGGDVPLLLNGAPLRSPQGEIAGAVLAFEDISDMREIERQKDALLATVSHILDGMTEAVVVIDGQGRIVRVNEAAERLFMRPICELVGRLAHDVFRWEDEGGRLMEDDEYVFHQAFVGAAPLNANGRYLRRPDDSRVPVSISSAPVLDAERGVQVAVEVIRDISREREAEELKDRIISLVSHELRTPIGHIKGFASSLLESDVTWDEATQRDFIEEIDREADRLATLVTDLLDMSKIESGKDFLERGWRRPAAIVEQALKSIERLTTDHSLVVEVPPDLPDVFADGSQLERVIGNLVENAAKYTAAGTKIQVSVRSTGADLEVAVTDAGPGIPPEYRERIFERFFRIKGGPAPKPGTGLGLPICRGIVQAHGGRLWLEERVGGGSCFRFTIPLQAAGSDDVA